MSRNAVAALVVTLLAGACHAPGNPGSGNAAAASPPSRLAERLAALPAAQRDGVFMRAITDAGFACQKIEASAAHAPIDGRAAWSIGCDHGNTYVALASPSETLQIVPGRPADAPAG